MATVLCVGGENLYSRLLLLRSSGFRDSVATTERAALALCRSSTLHAVILDTHSIVDPARLSRQIKNINPNLPVVLVRDSDEVYRPIFPRPFDRIISRLEGPEVLLQTINALLATTTATRASASQARNRARKLRAGMAKKLEHARDLTETMEWTRSLINVALQAIWRARDLREISSDLRNDNADYRDFLREQRLNALARGHAWREPRPTMGNGQRRMHRSRGGSDSEH
jgi:DNA-binding NtrC family response regulator